MSTKELMPSRTAISTFLAVIVMLISCKKNDGAVPGMPPPDDTKPLLKSIVIQNLPSPYFSFSYLPGRKVEQISFASGLSTFEAEYEGEKIRTMTNRKQMNRMDYSYSGNLVVYIGTTGIVSGKKEWSHKFQYDQRSRLIGITWYRFSQNGTDSVNFRHVSLQYNNENNLVRFEEHGLHDDGSWGWKRTGQYSSYDQQRNVDGFHMFKEFFENLLYLPGVRMQINNPAKLVLSAGVNEFVVDYTYQYQNGSPVLKRSRINQTKGVDAGIVTESLTQYTYY